jgi:hypothetical protein
VRFAVTAIDPDFDPLTYTWRVDGAVAATAAVFDFVRTVPGSYVITVNVSDGTEDVSRQWTVTVVGRLPPSDPNAALTVLLVILVAVVAVILFAGWLQRRRRRPW